MSAGHGKAVLPFVALCLALGVFAPPVCAQAPPAGKTYWVGGLSPASEENGWSNLAAAREGLGQLGYREGRNVRFELRWADGKTDRLPPLPPSSRGSMSTSSARRAR